MYIEKYYNIKAQKYNTKEFIKFNSDGIFVYPKIVTLFPNTSLTKHVTCFISREFIGCTQSFKRKTLVINYYSVVLYV